MRRVLVIGTSGSGKSTLSRRLAAALAVPHVELDALNHGPDWVPRPEFAPDVDAATSAPAWVVDGNYSAVLDLVWSRADTVVWLDLPRWLVEWRLVRRTAGRLVLRRELWNGNRERWRDVPRADHPIRWSWRKHPVYRVRYAERFAAESPDRVCVRLVSPREAEAWCAAVARGGAGAP
ncbi:adenylate kinase [Frankia sp. AgB32]|uniref:adenylate kinase n=1 Tax=Frankia sp. AgB32 TaxID=631119 RepID=UPI00200D32BD|nr:adenylate kinase [Frankia sp. AgB32]MCK9894160.1 adenylate kinase [Frankia sp. AgB32]